MIETFQVERFLVHHPQFILSCALRGFLSQDTNFTKGVEVIGNMESVVEALFGRTKALVKTHA